jgi:hypothetical protein
VSKFKSVKLVYDTHEYFTEVPELVENPTKQKIWLKLEKWIFPKLKNVYTVNESIAKIYSEKYKVPVHVIRNIAPNFHKINSLLSFKDQASIRDVEQRRQLKQ